ncbi:hypothetical protein FN846DRAFT_895444 [Sphaerosporella brunnea]|uniref:Uncharacterized protein n=1 Tax=Sphaerosporella brunnea TaxID=1250544 RepID=A0A5J5EG35_9PEZI|nr:hypothetical protein FN846DRAFT_895444 [Sphaerosporella brunnea]
MLAPLQLLQGLLSPRSPILRHCIIPVLALLVQRQRAYKLLNTAFERALLTVDVDPELAEVAKQKLYEQEAHVELIKRRELFLEELTFVVEVLKLLAHVVSKLFEHVALKNRWRRELVHDAVARSERCGVPVRSIVLFDVIPICVPSDGQL